MSQKSRLHRVAFPRLLAPEGVPFASVEHVHVDGAVELIQPHARPIFVPVTHYIPAFTRRRADGTQLALCETYVTERAYSAEPTCDGCRRQLVGDAIAYCPTCGGVISPFGTDHTPTCGQGGAA
jgi:hypothetical protein